MTSSRCSAHTRTTARHSELALRLRDTNRRS
jgi:hypothetical protein